MSSASSSDLFLGLVASLQASAWMLMGKVSNPMTGKIERDLARAQETIDLLGMLEEKTRGNLDPDEERFLRQILLELRMNYVEELKSPAIGTGDTLTPSPEAPPPADPG
jgi:Domain of unknown function (DUF1844)